MWIQCQTVKLTVQWTLHGTCNANVVLGIIAWSQRLHGIAMYNSVKKNKSMHMVEMLTGWMHLQHQHGSRAQEWQQQEHLSHECRQWSDMLDAYELLVLLTYSQQQRKTSCESNVKLSNCPMDPTWHLQCQRGSWHLRLKPTSAWNCNVQFCKKNKEMDACSNLLIVLREIMNMYTRANKKQIF